MFRWLGPERLSLSNHSSTIIWFLETNSFNFDVRDAMRRVVVTGLGAVTPLGVGESPPSSVRKTSSLRQGQVFDEHGKRFLAAIAALFLRNL